MPGRHRLTRPTTLTPRIRLVLATAAAVTLALGTIGAIGVAGDEPADDLDVVDAAPAAPERVSAPRADRGQRPSASASPSASPTASPSPTASASPPAQPTATPSGRATAQPKPKITTPRTAPAPAEQSCGASYYDQGETTANGEPFDPDGLTAAHKTFAFNTRVKVTNAANGKSVIVRINDRGPFVDGRCLDLARGAFEQIASLGAGVITVRYQVL